MVFSATRVNQLRAQFAEHVKISSLPAAQLTPEQKLFKKNYATGRRELEHEFGKTMRYKSIRELAGTRRLVDDDIRARLRDTDQRGLAKRRVRALEELTSRRSGTDIPKILERLDSGAIDVGIVTLPVKMPMLKVRTIFRDRLVLMVSADNPLAQHDKVPISMVVEQPLILPRTGFTRRIMDKLFRPYRDKLQVRMELPSIGMIKSFVAAGLGVSLISESFARDEVQSGKVKLIALKDNELSRELGLAYRRNRSLPRAAEVFIELLQRRTAQSGQKTATRTS